MARRVAVVPHTHWDREWYSPFQTFRLRLVDLLDEFLPRLEADPSYARFLLDGQMAVVDDYLEVRPEQEDRLRRLAASGRLAMGPWYILMDEFLVSGETIVRNMQLGLERAAAFAGAMPIGYLPDMFGHIAQMPQLLQQFGIEHATVWRGVPSAIDKSGFWWTAPDGSRVRAEYLIGGYSNGAAIADDAKALVRRLHALDEELDDFLLDGILFMNGTDHEVPQPWLGRVVAEANDIQDDFEIEVTSLAEYLTTAPTTGLPEWRGELRSGARANLLMGVASNHVDVKQAAARAERALERLAEPLTTLFAGADRWPQTLLDVAWKEVIRNSAHDSICACSHDDVIHAVLHRYAEARQIADGITDRAVSALATSMAAAGPVVVNPSHRTRSGLVQMTLTTDGPVPDGTQLIRETPARFAGARTLSGEELTALVGAIRSQQLDEATFINDVEIRDDENGLEVVITADTRLHRVVDIEKAKAELVERIAHRPSEMVRIRVDQPSERRVLARVEDVPGYGWARYDPAPLTTEPVRATATGMANGLVTVTVDSADGTFAIGDLRGLGRLVDDGDHGDTYNYSPPADDVVVDIPESVDVRVLEEGPLRARVEVARRYTWPTHLEGKARAGATPVTVRTLLELRAGERLVRIRTSLTNPCRDHRLRMHLPLPEPAAASHAECAFAVVERGLEAEGGPSEFGLPTFPARRFLTAGGLTAVGDSLLEYELVDQGATLALTLFRATGVLGRVDVDYRPLPAGAPLPLATPQMLGDLTFNHALYVGTCNPYEVADDAFLPLLVTTAPGGGTRSDRGSALTVTGAEVSSLRHRTGAVELRVFNPTPEPTRVDLGDRSGWLVDLRGQPVEPFDGTFELAPFRLGTARLDAGTVSV